jgi:hypothetical protein
MKETYHLKNEFILYSSCFFTLNFYSNYTENQVIRLNLLKKVIRPLLVNDIHQTTNRLEEFEFGLRMK